MIEQLKTIKTGLAIAIDAEGFVDKPVRRALLDAVKAAAQLEAMVGEQEPVAWAVYWGLPPTRKNSVHFDKESAQAVANQIKSATEVRPLYAAPVAQQPQKLEDIEQYRMQMAGISTAAIGYWKEGDSIHPDYDTLALRDVAKLYAKYDALHKAQQPQAVKVKFRGTGNPADQFDFAELVQPQAEAVPSGHVLVPVDVLKAASESLGSFVSDHGWTTLDMQAMDNIDAILAQQKGQP